LLHLAEITFGWQFGFYDGIEIARWHIDGFGGRSERSIGKRSGNCGSNGTEASTEPSTAGGGLRGRQVAGWCAGLLLDVVGVGHGGTILSVGTILAGWVLPSWRAGQIWGAQTRWSNLGN
jgi:hypothetical protein